MTDDQMDNAVEVATRGWRLAIRQTTTPALRLPVWYPTPDDAMWILSTRWQMEAEHDHRLTP